MTSSTSPSQLTVEIISDTTCPYCYIGYKRLLRAIALTNAQPLPVDFKLHFVPFQLDSNVPPYPGDDRRESLYAKFGQQNFERMESRIIDDGRKEGLNIQFQGRLSNTLNSHRVMSKAWEVKGEKAQMLVAEVLFKKYFEEAEDQADPEILADALERAGVMSKEVVSTALLLPVIPELSSEYCDFF